MNSACTCTGASCLLLLAAVNVGYANMYLSSRFSNLLQQIMELTKLTSRIAQADWQARAVNQLSFWRKLIMALDDCQIGK